MTTLLLSGATDGIGLATAHQLLNHYRQRQQPLTLLLHGRNTEKLAHTRGQLAKAGGEAITLFTYQADLSDLSQVRTLAQAVLQAHPKVDVLINNAGIFKTPAPIAANGLDVRFVVNTLAPYLLTRELLPHMPAQARVVNLSSAAQAPINWAALKGEQRIAEDFKAYAQSKLAITLWTWMLAQAHPQGPMFVAVNPGSLLASKMVKEGFGVAGNDLSIGADILLRAATSDEFEGHSGDYYDNDAKAFGPPHADARDAEQGRQLIACMDALIG